MIKITNTSGLMDWMFKQGLSVGDVAIVTGKSRAGVVNELNGNRDSEVLDFLRRKGCPETLIESRNIRRSLS